MDLSTEGTEGTEKEGIKLFFFRGFRVFRGPGFFGKAGAHPNKFSYFLGR